MTQEEKFFLIKDLYSRLPYGVKVLYEGEKYKISSVSICNETMTIYGKRGYPIEVEIKKVKPYLFPLSSMTEEQKTECFKGTPLEIDKYGDIAVKDNLCGGSQYTDLEIYLEVINWLLKNHFDIYGLIPKGLANDATDKNIY